MASLSMALAEPSLMLLPQEMRGSIMILMSRGLWVQQKMRLIWRLLHCMKLGIFLASTIAQLRVQLIMYAYIDRGATKGLHGDDIQGIKALCNVWA